MLNRICLTLLILLLAPFAQVHAQSFIEVPDRAVAAFYLSETLETLQAEYLGGVTGRYVRGFLIGPPVTGTPPGPAPQPPIEMPDTAVLAIYVDGGSNVCAIENLRGVKGRIGLDLGPPEDGLPACPSRCTLRGPNGSYCIPGCT